MAPRFKIFFFLSVFLCAASLTGFSEDGANAPTETAAPTVDALAMLEERFASLSGSLGKMTTPPKLSGTISIPSQIEGKIQLPGDGIINEQSLKENKE